MPGLSCDRVDEIIELFVTIMRAIHQASVPEWLQIDLTMAQAKVLFVLACNGPTTIGRVAESLGIGQPTASHLVDRLVRAELVERLEDPNDRRHTLARLTAQGEVVIGTLRQEQRDRLHASLAQLSADELAALLHGLRALAHVCRADLPPYPSPCP
jgi:DNA-binding MarR family transcriptional regulator